MRLVHAMMHRKLNLYPKQLLSSFYDSKITFPYCLFLPNNDEMAQAAHIHTKASRAQILLRVVLVGNFFCE